MSSDLISKNSFNISGKFDESSFPIINTVYTEVVEKLHKHKNTWNIRIVIIGNLPGNFPITME